MHTVQEAERQRGGLICTSKLHHRRLEPSSSQTMLKPCCLNLVVRPEEEEGIDDEAVVDAHSRLVFVSSLTRSGNG